MTQWTWRNEWRDRAHIGGLTFIEVSYSGFRRTREYCFRAILCGVGVVLWVRRGRA